MHPASKMSYNDKERKKRQAAKTPLTMFDIDCFSEESDDSDFRPDHAEESDDLSKDGDDSDSGGGDDDDDDDDDDDSDSELDDAAALAEANKDAEEYINNLSNDNKKQFDSKDALKIMICTVCLGDRSDSTNEIIECDSCGVTVHEGCYGVQDSDSVCSTDSPCPTTPWFCDACKAGLEDAECELCPNRGGIFKETDVGKWVHLICALYVPGVAFAEVDKLQNITLFEMAYSKWGNKTCALCQDQRFARTGVAVGCDAGMCKNYFHVTCGQREGLLAEANSDEADQADPYYAHCKLHTDKTMLKKRKRNWMALQMRMEEIRKNKKDDAEAQRIQRRLAKYRAKYLGSRVNRLQPWVPTQKMARLLTTSASACRALWRKAELSGVDTQSWALRETQVEALSDIHRRWHIPPGFSVEFIGYYRDRNNRISTLRKQVAELAWENSRLLEEQAPVEEKRDKIYTEHAEEVAANSDLKTSILKFYDLIGMVCPNKRLPVLNMLGCPVLAPPTNSVRPVPTAAAKKQMPPRKDSTSSQPDKPAIIPVEEGEQKEKKRKREKHHNHRYSPEPPSYHKHKHKRSKQQEEQRHSLKICFKSVPSTGGGSSYVATPSAGLSDSVQPTDMEITGAVAVQPPRSSLKKKEEVTILCDTCNLIGDNSNLVRCDECLKGFHFQCLDPPVKKSPKVRGYSWHCANCDPTENDDDDDDDEDESD